MKKFLIALFIVSIIVSCEKIKELNNEKSEMDSLTVSLLTCQPQNDFTKGILKPNLLKTELIYLILFQKQQS